jgi:hypothetical protein
MQGPWLKDVRIHDLRHTFTSTAIASGQGLPMIGKLLGHTQGADDGAVCASCGRPDQERSRPGRVEHRGVA